MDQSTIEARERGRKRYQAIRALAKQNGVSASGRMDAIIGRLVAAGVSIPVELQENAAPGSGTPASKRAEKSAKAKRKGESDGRERYHALRAMAAEHGLSTKGNTATLERRLAKAGVAKGGPVVSTPKRDRRDHGPDLETIMYLPTKRSRERRQLRRRRSNG